MKIAWHIHPDQDLSSIDIAPAFGCLLDTNRIAPDEVKYDSITGKQFTWSDFLAHRKEARKRNPDSRDNHEACLRAWFDNMELVKESPSATTDMYWWPLDNETVVLSAHYHS